MDRKYLEFMKMKHIEDDLEVLSLGYRCLALGNEALERGDFSYAEDCFQSAIIYRNSYRYRAGNELYEQLSFAIQMCMLRRSIVYESDLDGAALHHHVACFLLKKIAKTLPAARVLDYTEQLENYRKEIPKEFLTKYEEFL